VTQLLEYPLEGNYTITATSLSNGCSTPRTFTIGSDVQLPTLTFDPIASIDCGNLTVDLTINTDIPIATYGWVGPDGPLAEAGRSLTVNEAGTYEEYTFSNSYCSQYGSS